jgi:hypothetical protein
MTSMAEIDYNGDWLRADVHIREVVVCPEVQFVDLDTGEEHCFIGDEKGQFDFNVPAGHYLT